MEHGARLSTSRVPVMRENRDHHCRTFRQEVLRKPC